VPHGARAEHGNCFNRLRACVLVALLSAQDAFLNA
jgi:hypothetical protein